MASKNIGNSFPYLLADQSLHKYQASDRFRLFLAMKIAERAEIEMQYIKQVQSWINDLNIRTDNSDASDRYLSSELITKLLGSMRGEAAQTVELQQRLYNQLMSEHGPYSNLQDLVEEADEKQTRETDLEFHQLYDKRNALVKTHKKHLEVHEHVSHQIEALENQLSHRSRITSSRRPSSRSGPRKIDEMRDRLSHLRSQRDTAIEKIANFEEELSDAESSAKTFLTETEKRLRELETERMRRVISEIRRYFHIIQQPPEQRSPTISSNGQLDQTLDAAERLLKVHWIDVHTNARKGEMPDFRDMFGAPSNKSMHNMNAMETKQSEVDPRSSNRRELGPTESVPTYFSSYKSSSGSSVEVDGDSVLSVSRFQGTRMTPNKYPTQLQSQESIETLCLPPEVRCPADISVLEPNKQYTTRMKVSRFRQDDDGRQVAHLTEYSPVNQFVTETSESDEEVDDKVGNLRNVRVIAIEDNTPSSGSKELTFRKGQIIKQKSGANENSLCYGWTRENRVGRKQYGYYKQHKVKLFRKPTI